MHLQEPGMRLSICTISWGWGSSSQFNSLIFNIFGAPETTRSNLRACKFQKFPAGAYPHIPPRGAWLCKHLFFSTPTETSCMRPCKLLSRKQFSIITLVFTAVLCVWCFMFHEMCWMGSPIESPRELFNVH